MSEPLRDRLRRLRREDRPAASDVPPADPRASPEGATSAPGAAPGPPATPPNALGEEAADPRGPRADASAPARAGVAVEAGAHATAERAPAPIEEAVPRERASIVRQLAARDLRAAARALAHGAARPLAPGVAPVPDESGAPRAEVARAAPSGLAPEGAPSAGPAPRRVTQGPPAGLAGAAGRAPARTTSFARQHVHGTRALADALVHDRGLLAASARDPRLADIDLARAVFLDTETTGLAGGAGTYVFLVGLGTFAAERFDVWQGFLCDPREERALLAETAERIAAASAIVSFFGKSFDRHRLEDKMRVHGVAAPFERVPHLDLYWPLRRVCAGRFENGRLKTLERELCGVARVDDLPGSFAPAAWFDFLGDRPHQLEGVFRHNLEDILSLVALLPHAAVPLPTPPARAPRAPRPS